MKKLKEELKYGKKGITLISLVVTIIVLIILASVTINVLLGDNGLLNRANSSKEIYNKASVEEEVKIVLNDYEIGKYTGESYELKEFLENELSVTLTASGNNLDFIYKGYLFTINKNNLEILIMEKFNITVSKIFESVAEMKKDTKLTDNIYVKTLGYYNSTMGGGAYYQIVNEDLSSQADDMMIISLDNGLFAKYMTIGNMITARQMGAYGDWIHDDRLSIQTAANNLKGGTLYFETGTYKISSVINIYNPIILNGENKEESILKVSEGYALWDSIFRTLDTANINIQNLTFDGSIEINTRGDKYNTEAGYTLLWLTNTKNICIQNCIFKNNVYSAILLYENTEDLILKDCILSNVDCGLILRNYQNGNEYSNYSIENNIFEGHEWSEPISFDSSGKFSNIQICNNIFKDKRNGNGISFSQESNCKNVTIQNNKFYGQTAMMIFSSNAEDLIFSNNYITDVPDNFHAIYLSGNCYNIELRENSFNNILGDVLFSNTANIQNLKFYKNIVNLIRDAQILYSNVTGSELLIYENEFIYNGNDNIYAFMLRNLTISNIKIYNNKYSSQKIRKWIDNSTTQLYAKENEGGSFVISSEGEYEFLSIPYEFTKNVIP